MTTRRLHFQALCLSLNIVLTYSFTGVFGQIVQAKRFAITTNYVVLQDGDIFIGVDVVSLINSL